MAFGPSLILRLHEETGMSIRDIKHYLRLPSLPLLTKDNNDTSSLPALDEFYGIGRQEVSRNVKYAQWRVTLQRQGEGFRKSFRDDVYGDKDKSLEAAKAYRDQIVKNHLPMAKRDWVQIVKASTNASGIPGVIRVDREIRNNNNKPVRRLAWMAYCRTESGKNKQRLFSIRKYGEQRAFELALEAREAFVKEVKGYVLPLKQKKHVASAVNVDFI
ncbi:AP2 domain-containing protein [Paucimonas lemoignei]|uniref:AP2 domain-containing protein n=2 Tax=Paucimonas lemoignei TaxID=29443 RepID=A0A4R3I4J7_PAULE|nr:AP2 domain-containing protein [Paucimonas lemoignei]